MALSGRSNALAGCGSLSPTSGDVYGAITSTSAAATILTVPVGANDKSYLVSAYINCLTYAAGSFNVVCAYTTSTGSSNSFAVQGHFTSGYGTSISGVGSFEGGAVHIRAKANTNITVSTSGTFTTLTYTGEACAVQIA